MHDTATNDHLYRRKPDEMRYSNPYIYNDSHEKKFNFRFRLSTYLVIAAISFGILLVLLNIYLLYHMSVKSSGDSPFRLQKTDSKKAAWIYAKKSSHLKHLVHILKLSGYTILTSLTPPERWDLMWAYDFPFKKEFKEMLTNLHYDQKVNHLPGNAEITLKVELARSKLKWIPQAFSIPKEKDQFMLTAERSPEKLWVQKSNNHRGIKIVPSKEVDLEAKFTFVQEFVEHPMLVDGKKFDIGIYVVFTSYNPLQVYIYQDNILIRFCIKDYHPLVAEDVDKYVVGDQYINVKDMPSLRNYNNHGRMTDKDSLFTYLKQTGYDTKEIWNEVSKCIGEMFISKAQTMEESFAGYPSKHNFFELVRVDFVIDDIGKVWLMEVNMSPNLSSDYHSANALMYEQVIFHTLSLVGVSSQMDERYKSDVKDIIVSDRDITFPNQNCKTVECSNSCTALECRLCNHCLTDEMKRYIKKAFKEHMNKGRFARILPVPLRPSTGDITHVNLETQGELNKILAHWFKEKCRLDTSWCQ